MAIIDEPIELRAFDPSWITDAQNERSRLAERLQVALQSIEHIGSTAIPGLLAKPVLDLMLAVAPYPPDALLPAQLLGLGYEGLGEAGVSGRLYFRKRSGGAANLHVVERGGTHWVTNLAVRDYLRAHADESRRYAAVKQAALRAGPATLLAYSEAKASFLGALAARARAWHEARER